MKYISTIIILVTLFACKEKVTNPKDLNCNPELFPNYVNVTIPPNIAPFTFKVKDVEYSLLDVVAQGSDGFKIHNTQSKFVSFTNKDWKKLLSGSTGDSIYITISYKMEDKWYRYNSFPIYISNDSIDSQLVYRLIEPGYEMYSKMGIYQRNLSTYKQDAIIENTLVTGSCVNCHSFCKGNPKQMCFHVRGKFGGTVLAEDSILKLLKTKTNNTISKFVYPYWHPSGKYIAFSVNNTRQTFHTANPKKIEVFDLASDIIIYDVTQNKIINNPSIKNDSAFETFPSFSPDGKYLYYCSAKSIEMPQKYDSVHYNLCRIAFDPNSGLTKGPVDTLFNAAAINKSVSFPRPSPDGKFLMFTLFDYGNFSIWHKEADLYLVNLKDLTVNPMTKVNSNNTESYHSWSSNSKWFVFSSRRLDGLYTRPYIAHLNEKGEPGKPFLLPQENVNYYDNLFFSYNIPEFVKAPVKLDINQFEDKIYSSGIHVK